MSWWRLIWKRFRGPTDEEIIANRLPPHPANVPGRFYVEDGCCITCGVWEDVAPDLLAWTAEGNHCFVARQPGTDAEFERMMAAMEFGEVDCIRVHGCRPDWEKRLRDAGYSHHIDPPEGPTKRSTTEWPDKLPRRLRRDIGRHNPI